MRGIVHAALGRSDLTRACRPSTPRTDAATAGDHTRGDVIASGDLPRRHVTVTVCLEERPLVQRIDCRAIATPVPWRERAQESEGATSSICCNGADKC